MRLRVARMSETPYPGLRAFRRDESDVFFGRETHVDAMLERLGAHHFLAVTGASGAGKSSLVKTGLLDALELGFLAEAGPNWTVVEFRPGERALRNLAEALVAAAEQAWGLERFGDIVPLLEAELSQSRRSLEPWLAGVGFPADENLLILVDQFEELFRYRRGAEPAAGSDPGVWSADWRVAADAFVQLLLASAGACGGRVNVVLTMRSDFLGDCGVFEGLAERINESQFLTPRMTREQLRSAIEGPCRVYGGSIEPELTDRLLEEIALDADPLPLMQHALMRLWAHATKTAGETAGNGKTVGLRERDYREQIGGLQQALSRHADDVLAEVAPEADKHRRRLAGILFRCLTVGSGSVYDRRRPASLGEIAAVAGLDDVTDLIPIIEGFRTTGRHFLTLNPQGPAGPGSMVDITHESLIRRWEQLREWVTEEYEAAEFWRRLATTAAEWDKGRAALWSSPDIDIALRWYEDQAPTADWAKRYGGDFELAKRFVAESEQQQIDQQREKERQAELIRTARDHAERQLRRSRINQSRFLAAKSTEAMKNGNCEKALGLALEALPRSFAHPERADRPLLRGAAEVLAAIRVAYDLPNIGLPGWNGAFIGNGSRAVTVDWYGIHHWDATTGAEISIIPLNREDYSLLDMLFSADGSLVSAFGRHDKSAISIWSTESGAKVATLQEIKGRAVTWAFSKDLRWVVTGSEDGIAQVWCVATGHEVAVLIGHNSKVTSVAISQDGPRVITACGDRAVRLWSVADGNLLAITHIGRNLIRAVTFSPDEKDVIMIFMDGSVKSWDGTGYGKPRVVVRGPRPIDYRSLSPDRVPLATETSDGSVRISSLADIGNAISFRMPEAGKRSRVQTVAISPDASRIMTLHADDTIRLWKLSRTVTRSDGGPKSGVAGHRLVARSPDWSRVLTTREVRSRRWYDKAFQSWLDVLATEQGEPISAPFERVGHDVITAPECAEAWLSDTRTGARPVVLRGHRAPVLSAAFSPNGTWVVTTSWDGCVRLWDAASGAMHAVLPNQADNSSVFAAVSPDGSRVLISPDDSEALVVNTASGAAVTELTIHDRMVTSGAFSPDGARMVTASTDGTAQVWDAATGARRAVLRGHGGEVTSAVFSADGSRVLTVAVDRTARLWDVLTGAVIAILRDSAPHEVVAARFDADGEGILTEASDGSVRRWAEWGGVSLAEALAVAHARMPRALNEYERAEAFLTNPEDGAFDASGGVPLGPSDRPAAEPGGTGGSQPDRGQPPTTDDEAERVQHLWDGAGIPADRPQAIRLWRTAAGGGQPTAHERLGWLFDFDRGEGPRNLERALFHYMVAVRLFEQAGDTGKRMGAAADARRRQVSLASILPMKTVARIWERALVWQPGQSFNDDDTAR